MSLREIGEVIGVSTGTVSREIRRNCNMRGYHRYRWQLVQKKYERADTPVHSERNGQLRAFPRVLSFRQSPDGPRRRALPLFLHLFGKRV